MTSSESIEGSEWHANPYSSGICRCTNGTHMVIGDTVVKEIRPITSRDVIIADHAKARQVDALNKRLFELQWSVANESDLAVKQSARADKAEAKVDALVKALKLIEGTPGFGHTYAARIARDALAALQGGEVEPGESGTLPPVT
jgi:hypothetical protein